MTTVSIGTSVMARSRKRATGRGRAIGETTPAAIPGVPSPSDRAVSSACMAASWAAACWLLEPDPAHPVRHHPAPQRSVEVGPAVSGCRDQGHIEDRVLAVEERLRVQTAELRRLCDAFDGDGLGREPRLDPIGGSARPDGISSGQDLTPQPLVDLIDRPRERRSVLGPLEVADDDPT